MDFLVKFFLTIKRSFGSLFVEGTFRFAAQWRDRSSGSKVLEQTNVEKERTNNNQPGRGEERVVMQVSKSFSNRESVPVEKLPYPKRFLEFHTATLEMEGNVQLEDAKSDPGGKTAWGISSAANPDLSQEIAQGMSRERGFQIAYERYYSVIPNIAIMEPRIAFVVYDSRYHGMKENLVAIEASLKKLGYNIVVDGKFELTTYQTLVGLSKTEADIVMQDLYAALTLSAASAAKRTMSAQQKKGLEVHDYTDAFVYRQKKRLAYAETFKGLANV